MNKLTFLFVFLCSMFLAPVSSAQIVVAIGDAQTEKDRIFFEKPIIKGRLTENDQKVLDLFITTMKDDFSFYKRYFDVVSNDLSNIYFATNLSYDHWKSKKVDYLIVTSITPKPGGVINFVIEAFDINKQINIISEENFFTGKNVSVIAHETANSIYKKITGKESIFLSEIIFVSDNGSTNSKRVKELYIMSFNGQFVRKLTNHKGTVISPAISYDRKKIVYSLIRDEDGAAKNVDLLLYDVDKQVSTVISSKSGLNSGAVFLPDNKTIVLTLSHLGNAEIFAMDLETKALRRITNHFAIDVDPSLTFDGTLMTFLSGRSGQAMVYTLDPRGVEKDVKRISFVGQFNATPRFSPDGKVIAFASWLDESFDIFRINSDGTNLVRLTKNFGSNEDPSFSNDGEFLVFSSQRVLSKKAAVKEIFVMDKDGEIIKQLSNNLGSCITPRWSN